MIPYATLNRLKQHRGIESTNDVDDDFLMWLLRSASDLIHIRTCRHFIPYHATLSADAYHAYDNTRIKAPDDVLNILSATNGDGSSVAVTHNKEWIDNPSGWKFPMLKSEAQITGIWGYHETPNQMWRGVGTLSQSMDDETSILSTDHTVSVGELLKIEDEFLYVIKIDDETSEIFIERGVNGTDAQNHDMGATIDRYQQTQGIEWACVEIAAWTYKNRDRVNELIAFGNGGGVSVGNLSTDIWKIVDKYRRCPCGKC
jgi:hypothetical protein